MNIEHNFIYILVDWLGGGVDESINNILSKAKTESATRFGTTKKQENGRVDKIVITKTKKKKIGRKKDKKKIYMI